jgi:RNA polymerase sigma-70 factor, ECF subfamily
VGKSEHTEEDRELVGRCRQGDERAFEELVRKYQQTVFNVIYHNIGSRADVEDVAQKVFSKIYFSLPKFDNKRPFIPWLYRIAVNQCYDELRRARRRKYRTFTELSLEETEAIDKLISKNQPPPLNADDNREMYALLHKMLDQIPAQQKKALVLRDLEDIPYEQMAKILGCSEQAARLKVFRARARLRDLMDRSLRRKELMARG